MMGLFAKTEQNATTAARRFLLETWLAFAIAFAAMFALPVTGACAAEVIDCAESPGHGRWIYRIIDDTGRRCWFQANGLRRGREKPLEELRWPNTETVVPVTNPDPGNMQLAPRREGAKEGWEHKE
jgi:hypothetical protein